MTTFRDCKGISIYTTCPPPANSHGPRHAARVAEIARWSDEAGCDGILVYTDNANLDPWAVAQRVIDATTQLAPLVAVQPVYTHPYTVAKKVATLSYLYGRRVDLNFVAGGFRFDLAALGDRLDHAHRYRRLAEFAKIAIQLLRGPSPVSVKGDFYSVLNVTLVPPLEPALQPVVMLSGSSEDGRTCAADVGAIPVAFPPPAADRDRDEPIPGVEAGMRIGVIARARRADAWAEAMARFPSDEAGRGRQRLAARTSDSEWFLRLSAEAAAGDDEDPVYWLEPFRNYKTFCPYLVGSYQDVAAYLARYLARNVRLVVLDGPHEPDDLPHAAEAFRLALAAR